MCIFNFIRKLAFGADRSWSFSNVKYKILKQYKIINMKYNRASTKISQNYK